MKEAAADASPADRKEPASPGQDARQGKEKARQVAGGFTVPLSIELETMQIPLHRLQALCEGAVLPLEVEEPGPVPVRILAGGRLLARGTLVSVGPGYGVLVGEAAREEA